MEMNILKSMVLLTALMVFLSTLTVAAGSDSGGDSRDDGANKKIEWLDYDKGLIKGKEENKHIFIDFTAKWCGWCKKLDRETFADPEVIKMLEENFVSIKVDGESKRELNIDGYMISERDLTRREYGVRGFPALWFLKPDGSKIGPVRGYVPADKFLEALTFVKDRKYDPAYQPDSSAEKSGSR
jgi:thioredoxin-related protein